MGNEAETPGGPMTGVGPASGKKGTSRSSEAQKGTDEHIYEAAPDSIEVPWEKKKISFFALRISFETEKRSSFIAIRTK